MGVSGPSQELKIASEDWGSGGETRGQDCCFFMRLAVLWTLRTVFMQYFAQEQGLKFLGMIGREPQPSQWPDNAGARQKGSSVASAQKAAVSRIR